MKITKYDIWYVILLVCGFLFAKLYSFENWLCIIGMLGLAIVFALILFWGERKATSRILEMLRNIKDVK